MMLSLWTAATGMQAQATNVDVISNNLANANTAGFKFSRANFQDLMYQQVSAPGSQNAAGNQVPTGIQIGMGVRTAGVERMFSEGSFQQTGNPMDVAIQGQGFFEVQQPNGQLAYTRAGNFSLDSQGQVVTPDGYVVQPAITVPANSTNLHIASDGTVTVVQPGSTSSTTVGQIQIVNFSNAAGLKGIGQSLYEQTAASGAPTTGSPGTNGMGTIGQGMLEMSNVNAVEEMVNLIAAQRSYEMNSKTVKASDEMLQSTNNMKQ
jgi:flagellar basal-body rod protein FlgG